MAQKNVKKRLVVVSGVVAIVVIVVLAIVSAGSAARNLDVAEAATGNYAGTKVQVSGQVVTGSFNLDESGISFSIYDAEDTTGSELPVRYEGSVASTFGNDVSAICTGKMGEDGVLYATTLVTKCPSKYESGVDALSVAQVIDYGENIVNKPVKIAALLAPSTLVAPGGDVRFSVYDEGASDVVLNINYDGALSDEIADNMMLVLTGSLGSDGLFYATDVAIGV